MKNIYGYNGESEFVIRKEKGKYAIRAKAFHGYQALKKSLYKKDL